MNATARAIFAHRHTVAYRLDRVRELTGLDPSLTEDRERLGLGTKAYRILAPTLAALVLFLFLAGRHDPVDRAGERSRVDTPRPVLAE